MDGYDVEFWTLLNSILDVNIQEPSDNLPLKLQPELVILPAVDEDVGAGVGDQQQVGGAGQAGRPVWQLGR